MSTPVTPISGSNIPLIAPPNCPHCEHPLPGIGCYGWAMGRFTVLGNFCPHCMVALHFQIFQNPQAAEGEGEPGTPPSPVWMPKH